MAKTKYDEWKSKKKQAQIKAWADRGLSEKEIAAEMGIAYSTLREWKNKYPAFSALLKKSKEEKNKKVEATLFEKSTGFTRKVQKPIKIKETEYENGKKKKEVEKVVMVEEEVYYPPDTTAMIFYLKNRLPQSWSNEPRMLKLKEKDLQLKEKKIEQDEW